MSESTESTTHARVAELFEQAIELPVGERRVFLEKACGDEPAVLAEVLSILSQDEEGTKEYLVSPFPTVDSKRVQEIYQPTNQPLAVPERIGKYRIIRPLGAGGMGTVYLAEQEGPVPVQVALKVMRVSGDVPNAASRFEQERNVLRMMQHPNISRILDGGRTEDGLPFFVMEYVAGAEPLGRYARNRNMKLDERLELFLLVCSAVDHGHQKKILHRDLKPSNILVGRDGIPKLIDFGIARSLQGNAEFATRMTEVGQLVGTLQYISPEQLDSSGRKLDERSDVYSLGVVLYELLTDHLPYEVATLSLLDAARVIQDNPPLRPSNPALRGDLDTILFKALEKDPQRRYASVRELAADLERYRNSEPIHARPASLTYQLSLLARRNRGLVIGLSTALVALVAGFVVSLTWGLRAVQARNDAEALTAFVTDSLESADPTKWGKKASIEGLLEFMAGSLEEQFADSPKTRGRVEATIGRTFAVQGNSRAAEPHLVQACRILEEVAGRDDAHALAARVALGSALMELGRYREAEAMLVEALPRLRRSLGGLDANTLEALFTLAWLYQAQGRIEEAHLAIEEAVQGLLEIHGETHPDTLEARSILGTVYFDLGRRAEAEDILTAVIETEQRTLGRKRSDSLANLANTYWTLGRLEEAEALLRKAHDQDLEVLGAEHPWSIWGSCLLGRLLDEMGQPEEAQGLLAENVEIARRVLGAEHPNTVALLEALGTVLYELEKESAAEQLYAEVIASHRRSERRQPLAAALRWRGLNRIDFERFADAEEDLLQAHTILEDEVGSDDRLTKDVVRNLIGIYRQLDDAEAVALWQTRLRLR